MRPNKHWLEAAVIALVSGAYYLFVAEPTMLLFVDRLVTRMSLAMGPALAAVWVIAETVAFIVPFIAVRVWARSVARRRLIGAVAGVAAAWLPSLAILAGPLMFGTPATEFSGIGGALSAPYALPVDVVATVIGLAIVLVSWPSSAGRVAAAAQ